MAPIAVHIHGHMLKKKGLKERSIKKDGPAPPNLCPEIGVINDLPRASNFLGGVLEVRNSGAEPCVKANKTFHKRVG